MRRRTTKRPRLNRGIGKRVNERAACGPWEDGEPRPNECFWNADEGKLWAYLVRDGCGANGRGQGGRGDMWKRWPGVVCEGARWESGKANEYYDSDRRFSLKLSCNSVPKHPIKSCSKLTTWMRSGVGPRGRNSFSFVHWIKLVQRCCNPRCGIDERAFAFLYGRENGKGKRTLVKKALDAEGAGPFAINYREVSRGTCGGHTMYKWILFIWGLVVMHSTAKFLKQLGNEVSIISYGSCQALTLCFIHHPAYCKPYCISTER